MPATTSSTIENSSFVSIPLASITPETLAPVDLLLREDSGRMRLYRSPNVSVGVDDLRHMQARGLNELFVSAEDDELFKSYLASQLSVLLSSDVHSPTARLQVLNLVVSNTLRESFIGPSITAAVTATQDLAHHLVDSVDVLNLKITEVARMASHDYCTFTHSANVACYSVLLARRLGINDPDDLRAINAAGMLHDLGKVAIPEKILSKPGRLTDEEMAVIRLHPTRGFQLLRHEKQLSRAQLLMVYQHHERIDGRGYPVGNVGRDLHDWAKLCAVVDVFEALTGKRPYRRAATNQEAIEIMERSSGTHFDKEMLQCWISYLQNR